MPRTLILAIVTAFALVSGWTASEAPSLTPVSTDLIAPDRECVLPDRETVVADNDPRCYAAYGETVIPDSFDPETTPVTCWGSEEWSHTMCVPEESPAGGYVVSWLDNSPVYSDGWVLEVNDTTGSVEFIWYPQPGMMTV